MTALSDALTGAIEAEAMSEAMESCGITDAVDRAFLIASLDILKEWGVSAPHLTERLARENGEPEKMSDKQRDLIIAIAHRKQIVPPDTAGLTKAKASELIDSLQDGSYDPAKWSIPF